MEFSGTVISDPLMQPGLCDQGEAFSSPIVSDEDLLASMRASSGYDSEKSRKSQVKVTRPDQPARWIECVPLPGFTPRQVTIRIKKGKVVVVGRKKKAATDNQSSYEIKRTVKIPPDVDSGDITSHFVPRRFVLLQAPRLDKKKEPKQPTATTAAVWHGGQRETTAASLEKENTDSEREATDSEVTEGVPVAFETDVDMKEASQAKEGDGQPSSKEEANVTTGCQTEVCNVAVPLPTSPRVAEFDRRYDLEGYEPKSLRLLRGRNLLIDAGRYVEGKYFTSKESFSREVTLPETVDTDHLRCILGKDGWLQVKSLYRRQPGRLRAMTI